MATYNFLSGTFSGHQSYTQDITAKIITINLNAFVLAGWNYGTNQPSGTQESGMFIDNPGVAGTNSYTVNVLGSLGTYNGTGLNFNNYLATVPNVVIVGAEGGIFGTHNGIYSGAVTNVTNNGQISGQFAINYDGFWDAELNTLPHTTAPDAKPDSNIKAASVLTVTNALGAQILGTQFDSSNPVVGINNFSYAKLSVTNAGTITGGHDHYVDVNNDHQNDIGWPGAAINAHGALVLNNAATGVIDGNVESGWFGTTVTNAGQILGTISSFVDDRIASETQAGTVRTSSIDPTGTIVDFNHDGNFSVATGDVLLSATAINTYSNTGSIDGTFNYAYNNAGTANDVTDDYYFKIAIDLGASKDSITNGATGQIIGDVYTGAGNDTISNSGIIRGHVDMDVGDDTFTNILGAKIYGYNNVQTVGPTVGTSSTNLSHSGLWMGDGKNIVTNAGEIDGGVGAGAGFDTLTNTLAGTIYDGVGFGTGGSLIQNAGLIDNGIAVGSTDTSVDTVSNSVTGQIFGGVSLADGNNVLTNAGDIEGGIDTGVGRDSITNSGTMRGGINAGDGKNTIVNSGTIYGDINTGEAGTFLVVTGQPSQETITNSGTLRGGIFTGGGDRTITNSGTVYSDIVTGSGNDTLTNSKEVWRADLGDGNNTVTNSGHISNGVVTGVGNDTIKNLAGAIINQGVDMGDGKNNLDNAGIIYEGISVAFNYVAVNGGAGNDTVTIEATGRTYGSIMLGDGNNSFTNLGVIGTDTGGVYGWYFGGAGNDTITNSGNMGRVLAGSGSDVITNNLTGHIRGEVVLTGYSINADGSIAGIDPTTDGVTNISGLIPYVNELTNKGVIEGQVIGGDQADLVFNSGTIGGDVYLNGGNDKFDDTGAKTVGHIYLGAGDDTFIGGAINETVFDEAGHDSYVMGAGNDTVIVLNSSDDGLVNSYDGGTGNDTLDFSDLSSSHGITLQMENAASLAVAATNLNVGGGPAETAINFETVIGTQYADTINGTSLADKIYGGQGGDTLAGLGGADKIYAGITAGSLTGGDGAADTIRFDAATDSGVTAAKRDVVYQFEDGVDKLEFNASFDLNTRATAPLVQHGIGLVHWLGTNVGFDYTLANSADVAQAHAVQVGGQTIVEVDTNGDGKADFSVALDGIHLLQASDFIFL